MDLGVVVALIALNNMLFAFLIWVLPRVYSAAVLAVALGQVALFGFPLVVHAEPRFWLFLPLEAGGYVAAFFKRRWFVLPILAGAVVEVWPWLR
jgi:hypothetical protein